MDSIQILGKTVPLTFAIGEGAAEGDLDRPALHVGAAEMAALIDRCQWPDRYRQAFLLMKEIVFFAGQVRVNNYLMDRPCCDQEDAIFYWEAVEFMANSHAGVRANTFFHDCWHMVQFIDAGRRYAQTQAEQVAREVDAITHQIEAARILGCNPAEIQYLQTFQANQQRIVDRLHEGVNTLGAHPTGAMTKPA
jgi:hypothetical protein